MRTIGTVAALAVTLGVWTGSVRAEPLTFEGALARATFNAPALQVSALGVEAARSEAVAAGQLPDPRLSFGLDGFPVTGPVAGQFGEDDFTILRLGIEQDLPSRARRRAERAVADARIGEAGAEDAIVLRDVRIATGLAWIDLYYADRRLAALDEVLTSLEPLWLAAPSGVASGVDRPANALGPVQLRAALQDRRARLVADAETARAELARWTGDAAAVVEGTPPASGLDPAGLRAGLDRVPGLRAYAAAGRRAEAEVDLARAGRRPDWSFNASYGRRDPRFGDLVSIGASVSLPLFQGQRQAPVIAARAADALRVRLEREDAARTLEAGLRADLAEHARDHDLWRRARDVVLPNVLQRSDLETAAYAADRVGLTEVIEAFTAVANARLDTLDREAAVMRHVVNITLTYGSDDQ